MTRTGVLLMLALVSAVPYSSAQTGTAAWPSEGPPRPLPARDVAFPPYELRTLENGLQVVAVLHHEQPVVSMRMIVRAGASLDPRNKAGLANMAASLLDQGTTTMSAQQMNDQVDFIGGAMGAGAGTDLTFLNVVVMKDSFGEGLKILSDMGRHPAFAPEEIERQRQQALSSLQVSLEDPEFVADAVFDRLVYGLHPYGMPQAGTPETLASITRQDLVDYHSRNFVPNNAILAIVGDVTAEEAFDGARKVFGDWQRHDVPRAPIESPPEPARRMIIVNKPDAVQTEVRVGQLGVKRNTPDYMSINLTMRILGGEGANRLHQVLRTERALTYGAKADMDTLLESGDFEASTNTRSEATGEVLRLIVDQIWRLQRERVGERELSDAKAYLTGNFPLTIETPDSIATQVLNVLFYGLPVEELQSFRERVNMVRPEDIERAARSYLRPERLSIVLVGNAAAFKSQLGSLGFTSIETIEMADLSLMSPNLKRQSRPAAVFGAAAPGAIATRVAYQAPATQSTQRPAAPAAQPVQRPAAPATQPAQRPAAPGTADPAARELLSAAIAAKGGLERLKGVARIQAITQATNFGPNGQRENIETVTYLEYPDKVRVESKNDRAQMVQIFDGRSAWVKDPAGVHDVPEVMVRDLQSSFRRDTIAALLAANDGSVRVRLLPDAKDDAGKALKALEFSSNTLSPLVMYIDPVTHLIAKQTYAAGGAGQPLIEEMFDDYRPTSGVSVAFKATIRIGGQVVLERRVSSITINGPAFAPSLFTRPPA